MQIFTIKPERQPVVWEATERLMKRQQNSQNTASRESDPRIRENNEDEAIS